MDCFQCGDTPLHIAVRYNNYQVAKMLRKDGAKADNVNNVRSNQILFIPFVEIGLHALLIRY